MYYFGEVTSFLFPAKSSYPVPRLSIVRMLDVSAHPEARNPELSLHEPEHFPIIAIPTLYEPRFLPSR